MKPSRLTRERWVLVDRIFDAALDAPPPERERIVAEACGEDAALRVEVQALLNAQELARERFEEPLELAAEALSRAVSGVEGRRFGPFRILREVGRGGMGVVYLAEDTRLGRYVALKALPPYLGVGDEAKRRFQAEARAVSALDHPNIATLYEIDESEDGQLYMVFAFYEGETLEARIGRGALPTGEVLAIVGDIASGLGAAHGKRIIHRDVKPSNVMLPKGGGVRLLDFGVAKVAGEELTGEGVRLGTVSYMSPEQVESGPVDPRADLWSLGVVFYEMLTGRRPFRGNDLAATLRAILEDEPEPLSAVDSPVRHHLECIIRKLLSKEPDNRYQTTSELLRDIRSVQVGDPPVVAAREPPPVRRSEIRRLAVLPLADLTGEPGQPHIVHGVHDALIAELGKVGSLEVLSRTSVARFRDADLPVPEIADMLGVEGVVEGSVAREGDSLVITVQLIDASPERLLWAETYRRGLGSVLDVAAQVAHAIVEELGVGLTTNEERRLGTDRAVDPGAYEAFMLGLFHLERRSPEGLDQAKRYLQRAIEIDPGFAAAYAMLAEAVGSAAFFGHVSPAEGLPVVRSLVDEALALDQNLAAAHTSLGAVRHFGDWDWNGAEAALRRALELNPSYAYAYFILADVLSVQGRYEEALAAAERNGELERFVPFSAFGPVIVLTHMRRFGAAIARARAGLEFFTDFWQGHWLLGHCMLGEGRHAEAVAEYEVAAELSRRTPMALGTLGLACALDGKVDRARSVLDELKAIAESGYVGSSSFAMIHGGLGDYDEAFACLDHAHEQRDMALVHLGDDVFFDPLRNDRRFDDLLERMEIPDPGRKSTE